MLAAFVFIQATCLSVAGDNAVKSVLFIRHHVLLGDMMTQTEKRFDVVEFWDWI